MNDFLIDNQRDITYFLIIVGMVFVLTFVSKYIYRLTTKGQSKEEGKQTTAHSIMRGMNMLWLLVGILLISARIFSNEAIQIVMRNSKFIVYSVMVAMLTIVASTVVNKWFGWRILRVNLKHDDPTGFKFSRYVVIGTIYTIGVFMILLAIPGFKTIAQTFLGGAGIIALVAGLSSKEAFENIVSGIFIVLFKPFKIGDEINLGGGKMEGKVIDITLRHTVILNFENKKIVVPNASINKEKIINSDLENSEVREKIKFRISHDSNLDRAKEIILQELGKHPLARLERQKGSNYKFTVAQQKNIVVTDILSTGIVLRATAWVASANDGYLLRFDVLENVKRKFDEEGIKFV